jgi:hypothetical protein
VAPLDTRSTIRRARPRIVLAGQFGRFGDGQTALADAQIERRVDFRIVELDDHVVADDAQMRRPEGHQRCDVERAPADDIETGIVRAESQQPCAGVVELRLRPDPGLAQERHRLVEDASVGQGEDDLVVCSQRLNSRKRREVACSEGTPSF